MCYNSDSLETQEIFWKVVKFVELNKSMSSE
jgi:hypothetical protein